MGASVRVGLFGSGIILGSLLLAGFLEAQTGTISGRVIDSRTLQPIGSAQIINAANSTGVLSRPDGTYSLTDVPVGTHVISIQRIGYREQSQQVAVAAGAVIQVDFSIEEDVLQLDQIIVTGTPGGTQRRAIGNVVARVSVEEITEKQPIANMQEMLTGRVPGLNFTRSSGNVGTGSSIRIRGVSSMNLGTQPLIYVDGVRVQNSTTLGPEVNQGASSSALDDINPNDIASIEVIKGPAAATLYGTEASAGVIQIITKRGQSGAPQFDLTINQGSSFLMDAAGKIGDQYGRDPETNEIFRFNILEHERANGNKVLRNGHNQGYGLSVRGGTDAVRYYLSTDWDKQQGMVDYNWSDRISMRANVGVLITEGLNLDVSTGYSRGETSYMMGVVGGGIWDQLMWAQGHLLNTSRRGYLENTPEEFATISATRNYSRFTGSATMTHTPLSWLTQRLIVGTDYASDENQILYPRHPDGERGPFRNLSLGDVTVDRPINTEVSVDYSVSAKYPVSSEIGLTSSIGAQYYTSEQNSVYSHGSVFASPAIRSIEGATSKTVGQTFVPNKSLGLFFQQEMSFADRIYLTAAVRADDNSAFGSDFNAAIYPKFSAAWVISDESFWQLDDWINSLRLRSAWGKAGRQPSTFAAITLFEPTVGPGGTAAVTPGAFGNADVGPEVSSELEVGFEAAFLNGRLSTDFTYFYQKVTDVLTNVPLSPSEGFAGSRMMNMGRMDNWGWEAAVNARLLDGPRFAFDLSIGGDHALNEIVDMGGLPETMAVREGFPFPVYTTDIILSADFDEFKRPINVMCDSGTGKLGLQPGGPPVPCAETANYELLLGPQYPQYTWRFNAALTFLDNLQLFGLVEGEFGRWGSDTNVYCRHAPCYSNNLKALQRDDPIYEEAVVFYSRHPDDNRLYNYFDADFWKLREVGLRYQIPPNWANGLGASNISLALTGRNLWTIWQKTNDISGVKIPDVELTSRTGGSALMQVPGLSSFALTLRANF